MVGGAADDLDRLAAGIDLAQGETLSIRMALNRNQAGNGDGVQSFAEFLHGVDFETGHGQAMGEVIRRKVEINEGI